MSTPDFTCPFDLNEHKELKPVLDFIMQKLSALWVKDEILEAQITQQGKVVKNLCATDEVEDEESMPTITELQKQLKDIQIELKAASEGMKAETLKVKGQFDTIAHRIDANFDHQAVEINQVLAQLDLFKRREHVPLVDRTQDLDIRLQNLTLQVNQIKREPTGNASPGAEEV